MNQCLNFVFKADNRVRTISSNLNSHSLDVDIEENTIDFTEANLTAPSVEPPVVSFRKYIFIW